MSRIGVSPIGWSNDDLLTLGADISFERCLDDASKAGFEGVELGHKFPKEPAALRRALSTRGLELVSAWHGTRLLERTVDQELSVLEPILRLLEEVGARILVAAEVTGSTHRDRFTALSRRPVLHPEAIPPFGEALTAVADAVQSRGVQLAFHHHMGTVIQSREDIDALVEHTGESVGLTLDTGHATFAGIEPSELAQAHRDRIRHVHLKDLRASVLEPLQRDTTSFIDAIVEGVFTVPGDGDLDFAPLAHELVAGGYDGWWVVEADQDPERAEPFIYARLGHESVRRLLERAQ